MKKISIALAVFATALLSSCVEEKSFKDFGENEVVISLQGAPATRSLEDMAVVRKGATIELVSDENGHELFLEETIEDLNRAWAPATKGTPAYTENVGVLYKNKLGVYAAPVGHATYESMDTQMVGSGWRYNYTYASDPWKNGAVDFYYWMPSDMTSHGVTYGTDAVAYKKSGDNLTITFGYISPTTAAAQQDIIFAARNVTYQQYLDARPNGVPVLFNHALAGVKFAIANPEEASITSVALTGLVGEGSCTITPATENVYRDNTSTYSSADAVSWTLVNTATSATYSAEFGEPVDFKTGGKFKDNGNYPDTFAGAGAAQTNNLNDENATQTFWFIPQAMTDNVMLHITFTYGDYNGEADVEFGKLLAGVTWDAGQLRTYTIRVDDVNVKVRDNVAISGTAANGYTGSVKSNVVITNTGNTDAYIRAAVIGQWLDKDENPVFGFTDNVYELHDVASWYKDQFVNNTHSQGEFEGLVGYGGATSSYWVKGKDGYYYFMYVVPADGGKIPGAYKTVSNGAAEDVTGPSDPLFTSYKIKTAPNSQLAGLNVTIHFELEVATQAVSAKNLDGSYLTWKEAWIKALGYDPTTTDPTIQQ